MHLASDYIHPTPRGGGCRIHIYLPEEDQDASVVICPELPNDGGPSVTYAAEQLAAEVIRSHKLLAYHLCGSSTTQKRQLTGTRRRSNWLCSRATRSRREHPTWGRGDLP